VVKAWTERGFSIRSTPSQHWSSWGGESAEVIALLLRIKNPRS